jgi:hypothetical protein
MTGFENKADAEAMINEVHENLKAWAEGHAYTLNIPGRVTYGMEDGLLQFKVEIRQDDGKSNGQVQWERRFMHHEILPTECFDSDRSHDGRCFLLRKDDWSARFTLNTKRSESGDYKIVDYNDRKKKFKVGVENTVTGKKLVTTEHAIAMALGREVTKQEAKIVPLDEVWSR